MRLLNTKSLEVEEFFDENIPPYAILSHTWGDGEVSFQDIQSPEFARQARAGFAKVESACALASSQGHAHIWIDTCCIDKTSSAELSEAINSMYSWYKRASICYAYLVDVEYLGRSNMVPQAEAEIEEGDGGKENGGHFTEESDMLTGARKREKLLTSEFKAAELKNSRWFKRGWTLQELIAPSEVLFCSRHWKIIGRKSIMRRFLSEITGVDVSILAGSDPSIFSVARKMFWASQRMTTRVEDMAYCLMGLFSVTMPLIYGEGKKAFIRLQEEIIKTSDDQSIFAWKLPPSECSGKVYYGLLAESPGAFRDTGHLIFPLPMNNPSRKPTTMINGALHVELLVQPMMMVTDDDVARLHHTPIRSFIEDYCPAVLNCRFSHDRNRFPCIDLLCLDLDSSRFARVNPWSLTERSLESSLVPLRFKYHAISSLSLRTTWIYHTKAFLERFFSKLTPLDFKMVSVPQNPGQSPGQSTPLGFYLQLSDMINVHEGHPVERWFSNDRVLRRPYYFKGSSHVNDCLDIKKRNTRGGIQYHKEVTRVVEGVVRIGVEYVQDNANYFNGTPIFPETTRVQVVALVLGVDLISSHLTGYPRWEREGWCRLMELKEGMQLRHLKYEIDWEEKHESVFDYSPNGVLRARVVGLENDKLYIVELDTT